MLRPGEYFRCIKKDGNISAGDHESLWEKHKKSVEPDLNLDWFENRVAFLVERDHELAGKSVQEMIDLCAKLGYKDSERDGPRTAVSPELLFVEVSEPT